MRHSVENFFIWGILGFFNSNPVTQFYSFILHLPKKSKFRLYKLASKVGLPTKCHIDPSLLNKRNHGVNWWAGSYIAETTNIPQGKWSKEDIPFATKMANTLPKNKGGYFNFPENSTSIIFMPDKTIVRATKFWVKNKGMTWIGYPLP